MKKYFYSNGSEKYGPFTFEDLKHENINIQTLIWFEGLEDWKPAFEIEQMTPILELKPPPISPTTEIQIANNSSNTNDTQEFKEASQGWIIAGFIFSILGGFLGIGIGMNYAFGRYKSETKAVGWTMMILGIVSTVIWKSL